MPLEKARRASLNAFLLFKGPQRPYVYTDHEELQSWSRLSTTERVQLFILFLAALCTRLYKIGNPNYPLEEEFQLVSRINHYLRGEVFVAYNPPFVTLFYTFLAKLFGYNINNIEDFQVDVPYQHFPYYPLRVVSGIFGSLSIVLAYKTLRSTGVNHLISSFGAYLLLVENSLITQERFILNDGVYIFFISLFIASHKAQDVEKKFSVAWFKHVCIASVTLGLILASHWSGLYLLIYSFGSDIFEIWTLIGDVHITFKYVWKNFIIKSSLYCTIALTIYFSIIRIHLNALGSKGPAYNLLSPEYQASLENNHLSNTFSTVNFGSTVMFRHFRSGKYLHSHEDYYSSSGHQQVTLLNNYDDYNNLFKILATKGESETVYSNAITSPYRVRITHEHTQSSLVIDSNNKPPISEQEYNSEVTTDTDFNFNEDNEKRYTFKLKISNKYSKNDAAKNGLRAIDSVFQIYNEENGCYLAGTPLVLHEGFSEGQNEVICIKEPSYESSLWYLDWNDNPTYTINKKRVVFKKISFLSKMGQIHKNLFKKLYVGYAGYKEDDKTNVLDWILLKKGYIHWLNYDDHRVIYLLGNFIAYYLIAASVIVYSLFKVLQLATFNPFQSVSSLDTATYTYDRKTADYMLLYILVLVPMVIVKVDLNVCNYLPAVFVGILIVSQMLQWAFEKVTTITYVLLAVFTLLSTLAYMRFSPIIYGLPWTFEQCFKLMASPDWDRVLCDVFST